MSQLTLIDYFDSFNLARTAGNTAALAEAQQITNYNAEQSNRLLSGIFSQNERNAIQSYETGWLMQRNLAGVREDLKGLAVQLQGLSSEIQQIRQDRKREVANSLALASLQNAWEGIRPKLRELSASPTELDGQLQQLAGLFSSIDAQALMDYAAAQSYQRLRQELLPAAEVSKRACAEIRAIFELSKIKTTLTLLDKLGSLLERKVQKAKLLSLFDRVGVPESASVQVNELHDEVAAALDASDAARYYAADEEGSRRELEQLSETKLHQYRAILVLLEAMERPAPVSSAPEIPVRALPRHKRGIFFRTLEPALSDLSRLATVKVGVLRAAEQDFARFVEDWKAEVARVDSGHVAQVKAIWQAWEKWLREDGIVFEKFDADELGSARAKLARVEPPRTEWRLVDSSWGRRSLPKIKAVHEWLHGVPFNLPDYIAVQLGDYPPAPVFPRPSTVYVVADPSPEFPSLLEPEDVPAGSFANDWDRINHLAKADAAREAAGWRTLAKTETVAFPERSYEVLYLVGDVLYLEEQIVNGQVLTRRKKRAIHRRHVGVCHCSAKTKNEVLHTTSRGRKTYGKRTRLSFYIPAKGGALFFESEACLNLSESTKAQWLERTLKPLNEWRAAEALTLV